MKTTSSIKECKNRKFVLVLAMMAFLPVLLLWLATSRMVHAQATNNPTSYTITDLGTLGGTFSYPSFISPGGAVSGLSTLPGDVVLRSFLWTRDGMIDLGQLPGGPDSFAEDVNEKLQVTGSADGVATPGDGNSLCFGAQDGSQAQDGLVSHAYLWQDGIMSDLGTLGGQSSGHTWINNKSQVVGISEIDAPDPYGAPCNHMPGSEIIRGFLWQDGMMTDIGTMGGNDSAALYINNAEQIAGASDITLMPDPSLGYVPHHAFLWKNGVFQDLGTLGGGTSIPEAMDDIGDVVGLSTLPGEAHIHPFLWKNGTMKDLGTLPGDTDADAEAVNPSGEVVGISATDTSARAFIWSNGVMTDLNTLIDPNAGYQLIIAQWLKDTGQIAALALVESTREMHAVVLTPSNNSIRGKSARVPLTNNVRKLLRKKYGWARLKFLTTNQ